jgi:hypothetical protein
MLALIMIMATVAIMSASREKCGRSRSADTSDSC